MTLQNKLKVLQIFGIYESCIDFFHAYGLNNVQVLHGKDLKIVRALPLVQAIWTTVSVKTCHEILAAACIFRPNVYRKY